MKNIIPKTYNEVIRKKRCYDLAKYYFVSDEILVEIYNFLSASKENKICANRNMISFYSEGKMVKSIAVTPKTSSFDGVNLSASTFTIIPHYTSSSGGSGGSSSNNNN
ncbi:MAG: hypothetical protein J6K42_02020, partial [Clostridia bacterium]|nr:hypothetical protein [Clostridia bacterium]